MHDRLQKLGRGALASLVKGGHGASLKGKGRGSKLVVVQRGDADGRVGARIAVVDSGGQGAFKAVFDGLVNFFGNGRVADKALVAVALAGFARRNGDGDAGRVFLSAKDAAVVFGRGGLGGDGLAVSDLRRADPGLYAKVVLHAGDQNVKVKLAHAADNHLAGLRVLFMGERGVFARKYFKRFVELVALAD